MTTHYRPHSEEDGWGTIVCGKSSWDCTSGGDSYTAGLPLVTCHRCLEEVVAEGELAVARIIELDKESGNVFAHEAQKSSSSLMKLPEVGAIPTVRSSPKICILCQADGGDPRGWSACHSCRVLNNW